MALPLPKVVADVGPGGPLVTSMRGMNALTESNLENTIKAIQAKYAPLTTQAEAASKLAYANLMGPQFLAKLLGNEHVVANLTPEQRANALRSTYQAGTGQGTGNVFANTPTFENQVSQLENQPSLLKRFVNNVKNAFGFNESPAQATNPLARSEKVDVNPIFGTPSNSELGMARTAWLASPEAAAQGEKEGMYSIPDDATLLNWYRNRQPQNASVNENTYPENVGTYKGRVAEGEEAGKIRARDIDELSTTAFNTNTVQTTLDDLTNILGSSDIEKIRNVPLAGRHELAYYAREGSPEQQRLIGRYFTDMGNIIKDSARDFPGAFRKGEQALLNGMKPNDSDTVDVARGKVEALSYFNKMLNMRSKLTAQIMEQQHISKLKAQEIADKQINGEAVRRQINDRLNPSVTIKNKKTGEVITISRAEARKRGVPNV